MINAPESVSAQMQEVLRQRPLIQMSGQLERMRPSLAPDASLAKFTRAIEQCHLLDQLPATSGTGGKCSRKAVKVRAEGNRLYLAKDYDKALWKYNESICLAETGSEHLGMGYANRSAIFFEQDEYEYALANIALAKEHHYPDRLMPKLLEREKKCRNKLDEGLSKGTVPKKRFELNVPVNSKIPFLASGIKMARLEDFGRSMIATKSFKAGEVILHEKSILASIDLSLQFHNCNACAAEEDYSLIPCPNCATVMYCSQECLERDFRLVHRFECPIAEKVQHLSYCYTNRPIHPNEQICFSYGHCWWDTPMCQEPFQMVFKCKCVVCDPVKKVAWQANKRVLTLAAKRDFEFVGTQVCGPNSQDVVDLGLMQTYIQRHARVVHPRKEFGVFLKVCWKILYKLVMQEDDALRRAKVMARLEGTVASVVD